MNNRFFVGLLLSGMMALPIWGQGVPERARINPDDSTEAVRRLRLVDAYLDQHSWIEAVDLLQTTIETYPHQVIAVPASGAGVAADESAGGRYISVRSYCHRRISQLPADALALYRDRVDSQAQALWKEYEGSRDVTILHRIVDEFFCSSVSDRALEQLGDWAHVRGEGESALEWWGMILPAEAGASSRRLVFPDPRVDEARLWAKWGIAQLLAGRREKAQQALRTLKEKYPNARGTLAGQEGTYESILSELGQNEKISTAAESTPDWPTFAGNFARTKWARGPLRLGTVQHRWSLSPSEGAEPEVAVPDFNNQFIPFQQMPAPVLKDGLYSHPVTLGSRVFATSGNWLYWFDVEQAEPIYRFHLDVGNAGPMDRSDGYQTLSLAGRWLFVRTGGSSGNSPLGHRGGTSGSLLFCFDHEARKLAWWINVGSLDLGPQVVFEGAPVVTGDDVYVGVTRLDAMITSYVVCLDVETGAVRWKRLVCESTNDWTRPVMPDQNVLTLSGDSLFYCTNQGAIASIDVPTAKLRWLVEYETETPSVGRGVRPAINPCVHHHGRLFAVPAGASSLYCLDSTTGEVLWRTRVPAEHLLGVADGLVIVTGDRVYAVDEETGRVAWRFPENQPKGVGRGVLAGDFVYWPTASEIHVLDMKTGLRAEPAISLFEGLRSKPGNLVPGDGYVLIAQNRQILVVRPHAWLIHQREKMVADHPDSAEAHFLLASSAAEVDMEKANHHFQRAADLAEKESQERHGSSDRFVQKVRREWTRSIQKHVESRLAGKSPPFDSDLRSSLWEQLDRAFEQSVSTESRWELYQLARRLNEGEDPKPLVEMAHALLARPGALGESVVVQPRRRAALVREMGRELVRIRQESGDAPFASVDDRALASRPTDQESAEEMLRWGQLFPTVEGRSAYLLRQAKAKREKDEVGSLRLAGEVLRTSNIKEDRLGAILAMEQTLEKIGADRERRKHLDRIGNEFAREPWSREQLTSLSVPPDRSLKEYVSARRAELEQSSESSASEAHIVWTSRERSPIAFPKGSPERSNEAGVLVARADEAIWCRVETGKTDWRCRALVSDVGLVRYTPVGLAWGVGLTVTCLGSSSGDILWRYPEVTDAKRDWRGVVSTVSDGAPGGKRAVVPRHGDVWITMERTGDDILCLSRTGRILCLDVLTGLALWETDLQAVDKEDRAGEFFEDGILVMDERIIVRSPRRLVAMDRTGAIAWEKELVGLAGSVAPCRLGDRIMAVISRSEVAALNPADGSVVWSRSFAWPTWGLPSLFESDGVLLVLVDHYQLCRLNADSGEVQWTVATTTSPTRELAGRASVSGDRFLSTSPIGLDCRSVVDGRLLWRVRSESIHSMGVRSGTVGLVAGPPSEVTFASYDPTTGALRSRQVMPAQGSVERVDWSEEAVIVRMAEQVVGLAW